MNKMAVAAFALAATFSMTSVAEYPEKSVNYVIPFGPGGESDITARHQQAFFKGKFGEELVISYKPGGGGAVGWSQLNRMTPDGYNIMGINLPHIIVKPQQKDVGFKTDEIAGVYIFHYTPDAIVVNNDSPFKTLQDLIDYAKANPRKTTFSGSGKGTANHLAQVRFDKMAGIQTTYVAFKGTGKAVTALLGSQVKAEWGYTSVGAKPIRCVCWRLRWTSVILRSLMCRPSRNWDLILSPAPTAVSPFPRTHRRNYSKSCLT